MLAAVFGLVGISVNERRLKVHEGILRSIVEIDVFAALYHERQQQLCCDVLPADLGLVGNSSAVAVVAVQFQISTR